MMKMRRLLSQKMQVVTDIRQARAEYAAANNFQIEKKY